MFCPECRTEYVAGVVVCAECGVPLVARLAMAPPPEFVEYEEILSTRNPGEIAVIKSLLEDAGMEFRFSTEAAGPPLALPARLLVPKDRVGEAREILDHFIGEGRAGASGEGAREDD